MRRLVLFGENTINCASGVLHLLAQDKALWEPWPGRQPTHIPSTLLHDFGQQEEEQLQPLSIFPGKSVGIYITMRRPFLCRVCQALSFKFLYYDALLCDILRMRSMVIAINETLFSPEVPFTVLDQYPQ